MNVTLMNVNRKSATIVEALSVIKRKIEDNPIVPGVYTFNQVVALELKGQATKKKPYERRPTVKIPQKGVLAAAFAIMGFQRENLDTIIEQAVRLAMSNDTRVKDYLRATEDAWERVEKTLDKLPPQICEGSLDSGEVTVTILSDANAKLTA